MLEKLDRWIDCLEGFTNESLSQEKTLQMICTKIAQSFIDNSGDRTVLFTGTIPLLQMEVHYPLLQQELMKWGIDSRLCANPVHNVMEFSQMPRSVVLIEEQKRTTDYELGQLLRYCAQLQLSVFGCIWLMPQ